MKLIANPVATAPGSDDRIGVISDVADMASIVAMPSVGSVAKMHGPVALNHEMDALAAMYVANPVDGLNGCDQAAETGEICQKTGFSLM